MAAQCVGVMGAFQYSAPKCDKKSLLTSDHHEHHHDNKHSPHSGDQHRAESHYACAGKYKTDTIQEICPKCSDEFVWVRKRYEPNDLRFEKPVPRFKIVVKDPEDVCRYPDEVADDSGKPCRKSSTRDWIRPDVEREMYISQHHTRCEQWSTLREMLPSRGRAEPVTPPNWGTGRTTAPVLTGDRASRFPQVNSEMTKFCDTAHTVDPMFSLF